MLKKMQSRFRGKCAATGKPIKKGDQIFYDDVERKAYLPSSELEERYQIERENESTRSMIQANEDAYFDNWAAQNL